MDAAVLGATALEYRRRLSLASEWVSGRLVEYVPPHRLSLYLLFAALIALKLPITIAKYVFQSTSVDGGYYLDLAQNVRDGLGLYTDISSFHQGLPYFPHPTPVYPLWPLVLGYSGRVVPLEVLAFWLPCALYLLTTWLAWRFGRQTFPQIRARAFGLELDAGHVLALLIGLHTRFTISTSVPYTEGLAYALLLLALLRVVPRLSAPTGWTGLELGAWAALLFLCRSQLVIFAIAAVATVGLSLLITRRRSSAWALAGLAVGFWVVFLPELLFLRTFVTEGLLYSYFRFDQYQATHYLPKLRVVVETDGWLGLVKDRLSGFLVAFDWRGEDSYFSAFHGFTIALLVAPLAGMREGVAWLRRHGRSLRLKDGFRAIERHLPLVFFLGFAAAAFLSVHAIHMTSWGEWPFAGRHGLFSVFAVFVALVWLLRDGQQLRAATIALVLISSIAGWYFCNRYHRDEELRPKVHEYLNARPLIEILNAEAARLPDKERLVVVVNAGFGKRLAPFTPRVAFHELTRDSTVDEVRTMFIKLGARLFVFEPNSTVGFKLPKATLLANFEGPVRRSGFAEIYRFRQDQ